MHVEPQIVHRVAHLSYMYIYRPHKRTGRYKCKSHITLRKSTKDKRKINEINLRVLFNENVILYLHPILFRGNFISGEPTGRITLGKLVGKFSFTTFHLIRDLTTFEFM